MPIPINIKGLITVTGANSFTAPANVVDDYVFIAMDRYAGVTIDDAGYSVLASSGWNIYYKKVVTPIDTINMTTTSNRDRIFAFTVRGAHPTDLFDGTNPTTHITVNTGFGQQITTNTDNCLILAFSFNMSGSDQAIFECPYEPMYVSHVESYTSISAAFTYQHTAGLTQAPFMPAMEGLNCQYLTLAIRDDGSNTRFGYQDPATKSTEMIAGYRNNGETQWASELVVTSVSNGTFTANTDGSKANSLSLTYKVSVLELGSSSLATGSTNLRTLVSAGGWTLNAPIDLTGKTLAVTAKHEKTGDFITQLGQLIGVSDGTNTRIWNMSGSGSFPNRSKGEYPYIFKVDDGYHLQDQGTVNATTLANTQHIFLGHYVVDTNMEMIWGIIRIVNTQVLVGGSANTPVSFKDSFRISKYTASELVQGQNEQTEGQYLAFQKIQIGGSNPIYFKAFGESIAWSDAYSLADARPQCAVGENTLGLCINLSDGDTIDLSGVPMNFGNFHPFEIVATTSKLATYNFNNNVNQKCTPTLNNVGSVVTGLSILSSREVVYTDLLDMSGGCTFSNCVSPVQITISSEADFVKLHNCNFTDCSIAIRITGDQTGTWADPSITFNGNVTDIEYTGTTNFEIGSLTLINVLNSNTGTLSVNPPQATLTLESNVYPVTVVLHDLDSADPQDKGTELLRADNTNVPVNYIGTANNLVSISAYKLGYRRFYREYTIKAVDDTVSINLIAETN